MVCCVVKDSGTKRKREILYRATHIVIGHQEKRYTFSAFTWHWMD